MRPFRVIAGTDPALAFEHPYEVLRAWNAPAALQGLRRAQEALERGAWIAGYVAYELGAAFAGLPVPTSEGPLLALGLFGPPRPIELPADGAGANSALLAESGREDYDAAIASLQRAITDGDVYQVNYTVPFALASRGDLFALYAAIARRTRAPYQAFVEDATRAILSWSPELFLEFDGDRIATRPMKGTAPLDDAAQLQNEKNRAEHLMIVDLLRNDLHRVCDDVGVERLFSIERYPTFATMTSTIAGRLRPGVTLLDTFRAAFPCGSVTGAPKRSAIAFISSHEARPRGVYCGTVGYLSPQRRGWWNVAIRTAQLDVATGAGRFDAGGGIVADSNARDEWEEIQWKMRFLRPDGFAILETFAGSAPDAIEALHLARLERSARAFGVSFDLACGVYPERRRRARADELVRVRMGLDGDVAVEVERLERVAEPVAVCFARAAVRAGDPFLRHKTSWRPAHELAACEAEARGCFDALLHNERDELTEGSRTNLFFELEGQLWTPPLASGLLPGILRQELLARARVRERAVTADALRRAGAVYVGNSARGMLRARLVE